MAVPVGKVFFERCIVVVGGVLKRAVVVHCRHCGYGVAGPQRLEAAVWIMDVRREDYTWEMARRQLLADKEEKELETVRRQYRRLLTRGGRAPPGLSVKNCIDLHRHLRFDFHQ